MISNFFKLTKEFTEPTTPNLMPINSRELTQPTVEPLMILDGKEHSMLFRYR